MGAAVPAAKPWGLLQALTTQLQAPREFWGGKVWALALMPSLLQGSKFCPFFDGVQCTLPSPQQGFLSLLTTWDVYTLVPSLSFVLLIFLLWV